MAGPAHQLCPGGVRPRDREGGEDQQDQRENQTIARSHTATNCFQG